MQVERAVVMLAVLKLGANVDALSTPDGILPTMHCRGRLFSVCVGMVQYWIQLTEKPGSRLVSKYFPGRTHFAFEMSQVALHLMSRFVS